MAKLLGRCPAGGLRHALWIQPHFADLSFLRSRRAAALRGRREADEPLHRIESRSHLALPLGNGAAFRSKDWNRSNLDDRWASSPCSPARTRPGNFWPDVTLDDCSSTAAAVRFSSAYHGSVPLVRYAQLSTIGDRRRSRGNPCRGGSTDNGLRN